MSKIQSKYKGNGVYEFDFKGKIKDNTMLKIAFKKDKLFIKTIKNKQKFKKMKKSKKSFESLEQSIIEMIRFMETNPEKEKKEFEKKENLKNEMELLEKNITEFAQALNDFEDKNMHSPSIRKAIIMNKSLYNGFCEFTTSVKQKIDSFVNSINEIKNAKDIEIEKVINKICNKGSIMTDFAQNKAKEAILEALKNMKIEPQKEKKEVDIEYYLNFTSKDASKEGQEAYNKQLIEIIEKIKEAAKEGKDRCTFNNIANYIIRILETRGFKIIVEMRNGEKIVEIAW